MTKCDFCTQSSPKGVCYQVFSATREEYCKNAIRQMVMALRKENNKKNIFSVK